MSQTADPEGAVGSIDRTWRATMERRVRDQCGPRRAAAFDEAWGDLLGATWRSGRGPIQDEGEMWAVLQTFLGFVEGKRRAAAGTARVLTESELGTDLQWFEGRRSGRRCGEPAWVTQERRRGGKAFEAVWLVNAMGLTYPEACDVLGVRDETLRSRLKTGRAALRRRWAGKEGSFMWSSEQREAVELAVGELVNGSLESCSERLSGMLEELGVTPEKIIEWIRDFGKDAR